MEQRVFLLSAGGTGGHLFPAQALADELHARGHLVHLATDERAKHYADKFPCDEMYVVPSATISSKNLFKIAGALWKLYQGIKQSRKIIKKIEPAAVVGFGGYPTIPPLLAASQEEYPTILHEQNGVMGRANKLLAGRVTAIAGGFLPPDSGGFGDKIIVTGNPVRPSVIEAAEMEYKPAVDGTRFNLLVFGGSQGAQFFGQTLPEALSLMNKDLLSRLQLTLQARAEDIDAARNRCDELGISADIAPFFDDMANRIGDAHLVISRSGASTVSELAAIGRPALLVPYPYALDHDQAANAQGMVDRGGAEVIPQSELDARKLATLIESKIDSPLELERMAVNAKLAGKPDATSLLADMVEAIANGKSVKEFKDQQV